MMQEKIVLSENVVVRDVIKSDAGKIADIYNYYIVESTATFDTDPVTEYAFEKKIESFVGRFPFLVAEYNGIFVGFCYAHPWKEKAAYSRCVETTIYLQPSFSGKGIGEILMHRLIAECLEKGYKELIACITAENQGSIEFHKRLGFEEASRFRHVGEKFGRLLDVIDLQLSLSE